MQGRRRAAFKFSFWALLAVGLFAYVIYSDSSGQLASWFYYSAAADGYAVDADAFRHATRDAPATLEVGPREALEGLVAVPVKKGDRLPRGANGVITNETVAQAKRVVRDGDRLRVLVPWEIQQAKGFKFKDTFKHKGMHTYPWAGVWNVAIVFALGLCLGFMAEGFTDLLGMKLEKIRHFEGH